VVSLPSRVAFSIGFDASVDVKAVPTADLLRVVAELGELAESIAEIPRDSAVWRSLQEGPLMGRAGDWSFRYIITKDRSALRVMTLRKG
jgi:hypothetical protein